MRVLKFSTAGCIVSAIGHWLAGSSDVYVSTFLIMASVFSAATAVIQELK